MFACRDKVPYIHRLIGGPGLRRNGVAAPSHVPADGLGLVGVEDLQGGGAVALAGVALAAVPAALALKEIEVICRIIRETLE